MGILEKRRMGISSDGRLLAQRYLDAIERLLSERGHAMAIAERALQGQSPRRSAWRAGTQVPAAIFAKTASNLGRLLLGSGGGPRSYPRERFSDYELHQIVAGRKDSFDGLG